VPEVCGRVAGLLLGGSIVMGHLEGQDNKGLDPEEVIAVETRYKYLFL
jgi:hypothetical protein